jgi:hypothetical protein
LNLAVVCFDGACLLSAIPLVECATNRNVGEEIEQASFVRCGRGAGAIVFIGRQGSGCARQWRIQSGCASSPLLAAQKTHLWQKDARPLGRKVQDVRKLLIGNQKARGRLGWRPLHLKMVIVFIKSSQRLNRNPIPYAVRWQSAWAASVDVRQCPFPVLRDLEPEQTLHKTGTRSQFIQFSELQTVKNRPSQSAQN